MLLVGNEKSYIVLFFFRHILNILDSIKHFEYNMEIKFDKDSLVAEQKITQPKLQMLTFTYHFQIKKRLVWSSKCSRQ